MSQRELSVEVDAEMCVGYMRCNDTAPDYFIMDDDGVSHFRDPAMDTLDQAAIEAAVNGCPVHAIRWSKDGMPG
jgi:ferredoxin